MATDSPPTALRWQRNGIYRKKDTQLQRLAASMKVSLAWVVRQAIEEYMAKQRPGSAPDKRTK
ncbi:ribbon-helix-helix protein, CopG family [Thiobacter aerophilum]|uniref:ribbon-helix-helix protein, CopG family n=1 Tax=Thiobacter aerophilum TaxID=3121275 RepID=UPI003D300141